MTDSQTSLSASPQTPVGGEKADRPVPPQNWREALVLLLGTRAAILRIEAADATAAIRKRVVIFAGLGICAFFTWALLLTGGIPALAHATGCAWHWIALGAAFLHLFIALILAWIARHPSPATFQATKAEFQKDREWLLKL